MSRLTACLLASTAIAHLGAKCNSGNNPDLSSALEDVAKEVPGVCEQYCEEKTRCEWGYGGEESDSARDEAIDNCALECAWYMANGCQAVKETCEYSDEDEDGCEREYLGNVDGASIQESIECIFDLGLNECYTDEEYGFSHYYIYLWENVASATLCTQFDTCAAAVDWDYATSIMWHDDPYYPYCEILSTPDVTEEDYAIYYFLDCSQFFVGTALLF